MADIRLLEKSVYELIAAGEVVSRPSCVVKELVENSIDALASFISIEIKDAGKSLIRVIDNGIGIKNKDCCLAFTQHATSKILKEEDLYNIKTLGFRGEALASICAVSKVLMLTKTKNEERGVRYVVHGGQKESYDIVDVSNGTTIEVRDIFYNVPARFKFLKKDSTEVALIKDVVEKLALSHCNISFEFKKDGVKTLQTFGTGSLKDTVYSLFGEAFCENLIEIDYVNEYIRITGFVSSPSFCKSYRSVQYLFVNSRCVTSKLCVAAVEEAFKGSLMVGRFPCFIICMGLPFKDVDVNVHPNKVEVRFYREKDVLKYLSLAVKEAIYKQKNSFILNKTLSTDNINLNESKGFVFESGVRPYNSEDCSFNSDMLKSFKYLSTANIKLKPNFKCEQECGQENSDNSKKEMIDSIVCEDSVKASDFYIEDENLQNFKLNTSSLKVIGELFKLYILAEIDDVFIIIDKHAAHEKILYEKLIKEGEVGFKRQILVEPIKIYLNSYEECDMVLQNCNIFLKFGFVVDSFHGHCLLIREVPLMLVFEDVKEVFGQIVSNIKYLKENITPKKLEDIYSKIACKAAIKANQLNNIKDLETLANEAYFNPNIRNCPHGRPVIFTIKKGRFDKKFGRQ